MSALTDARDAAFTAQTAADADLSDRQAAIATNTDPTADALIEANLSLSTGCRRALQLAVLKLEDVS